MFLSSCEKDKLTAKIKTQVMKGFIKKLYQTKVKE